MLFRSRNCESKVQVVITTAWCSLCTFMLFSSARALESREYVQLLWTYFAPAAPPLLMLWLWAHNNAFFERHHIPFAECFPERERRFLAPATDLYSAGRVFSCLTLACLAATAMLCSSGRNSASSSSTSLTPLLVPPLYYGLIAFMLAMPINVLRRGSRRFLVRTLLRVLAPLQAVSWADFLLADMLTSLAKSSSDLSRSMCLMLHGPLVHPKHPSSAATAAACGPLTAVSLSALVLPYFLRMLQCLSIWRAGGPRSQLFNALKYASSLPALVLTALEHEHHVHHKPFLLRRMWVGCMVLNSAYSYYWDVEQDWDMPWIMQYGSRRLGWLRFPGLKPNHCYPGAFYSWLLLSNLLLRFSWAHRLLGDLQSHNEVLMAVALLEVLRRWQWVFVRVETELRKLGLLTVPLAAGLGMGPADSWVGSGITRSGIGSGCFYPRGRKSGSFAEMDEDCDYASCGDGDGGVFGGGAWDRAAAAASLVPGKQQQQPGDDEQAAAPLLVRHVSDSDGVGVVGGSRPAAAPPTAGGLSAGLSGLPGLLSRGWRTRQRPSSSIGSGGGGGQEHYQHALQRVVGAGSGAAAGSEGAAHQATTCLLQQGSELHQHPHQWHFQQHHGGDGGVGGHQQQQHWVPQTARADGTAPLLPAVVTAAADHAATGAPVVLPGAAAIGVHGLLSPQG